MNLLYLVVFTPDAPTDHWNYGLEIHEAENGDHLKCLVCTSVQDAFGGFLELVPHTEEEIQPPEQQEALYVRPHHVAFAMRLGKQRRLGFSA